ncbi:RNA-directed DNA polymerase [Candidatus Saccharibacteria bacterium]|nr:RNA-directed DNA polymerase [Candidatus Saccharibacteria bacterium]
MARAKQVILPLQYESTEKGAEFEEFLLEQLWKAYLEARKGKRHTDDEQKFEMNEAENLVNLRDAIISREYETSRGIAFVTTNPVPREIFAAPFRDRVVHHFLFNICNPWWDKRLIYDSYSCRLRKGTHFGIRRMQHHMRSVTNNFTEEAWIIKLDIQAFFMNLDRELVLKRILWGLDRQFKDNRGELYETCKFLWKKIILDDPVVGVRRRGRVRDWDILPKSKSLFYQPAGVGIVIGNLTSQLASNIYLDLLDRFIVYTLGYKHYGRYVDDFYYIVPTAELEKAKKDIEVIANFLNAMGLTLHPDKVYIQRVSSGINYLGARLYPGMVVPGYRIKHNYKKAAYDLASGHGTVESFISYMGMMTNFASRNYEREIFQEMGWEYKG